MVKLRHLVYGSVHFLEPPKWYILWKTCWVRNLKQIPLNLHGGAFVFPFLRVKYACIHFSKNSLANESCVMFIEFSERRNRSDFSERRGRNDVSERRNRSDFSERRGRNDYSERRNDFSERRRSPDYRNLERKDKKCNYCVSQNLPQICAAYIYSKYILK